MAPTARNARAEAAALIGDRFDARVLEPSPPAIADGDWYADDPAVVGDVESDKVVTPTTAGGVSWSDLAAEDPAIVDYAIDHALIPARFGPVPGGYGEARVDLNRLAFYVISLARRNANGKIGLRYTAGGFGTPFFGEDTQIRVEGTNLVRQHGGEVEHAPISTLAAAATFVGVDLDAASGEDNDVPELGVPSRRLSIDAAHVSFVASWFGFATAVLEELRLAGGPDDDVTRVQLWPEHFDPAVELGSQDAGARASFGGSPGDSTHPEPYLYVAAWGDIDRTDPYWNDDAFNGASLSYRDLRDADEPHAAAVEFLQAGFDRLRKQLTSLHER
jgi:hypothetical protein